MPGRLLLLEDDPAIAHTAAYALQREGFEVDHVLLVREAFERLAAAAHGYAAAVLDVGLPDGSGLDLCRALRAGHGGNEALPVVLLTARGEELDRVLGLELGADDYVTKPFSPRELCARVRSLLRRAALPSSSSAGSAAQRTTATLEALVCDDDGQRILHQGVALPLTRLEHGLLRVMLRSPGRIWSRDALLDAVWGHDAASADRTVDTHIKTLRAKLREACGGAELIVTHRGMGYALDLSPLHAP